MRHARKEVLLVAVCMAACAMYAESTSFRGGLFRYAEWGHSLYADEHPNFVRQDIAYTTNHPAYDYGASPQAYRWQVMGVFGIQLPLWHGQVKDSTMAISVHSVLSANLWMDLFGKTTSPIVDCDYRIGMPSVAFLHRINRGFARNYAICWSSFKHESTHIGDELQIQHVEQHHALKRVNVSYNYTELTLTLNEAEEREQQNHCFRIGLMLLWDWKAGWYQNYEEDGGMSLTRPRLSPWELYVQYQYQSPTSKHGFQGIASIEIRNRARYGYDLANIKGETPILQDESRIFTYNVFIGARYCAPHYKGIYSHWSLGIRAYHGNCPYGQFRNIKNFNQIGLCLIVE